MIFRSVQDVISGALVKIFGFNFIKGGFEVKFYEL